MSKILLIDNFDVPYLQLTKSQSSSKSEPVDVLDREKILESVVKKSREGLNRVLAVLEGPYFVPDGYSQNKRFYPRKLWEKVVSEVRDDLKTPREVRDFRTSQIRRRRSPQTCFTYLERSLDQRQCGVW